MSAVVTSQHPPIAVVRHRAAASSGRVGTNMHHACSFSLPKQAPHLPLFSPKRKEWRTPLVTFLWVLLAQELALTGAQDVDTTAPCCSVASIALSSRATTGVVPRRAPFPLKHSRWAPVHHSRHALELRWVLTVTGPLWTGRQSQCTVHALSSRHFPYKNESKF
jgi:hypothetical protein